MRHDCCAMAMDAAGVYLDDGGDDGRDMMADGRTGWCGGDCRLVSPYWELP